MPWITDGINALESSSLDSLRGIAMTDLGLANRVSRYAWYADGVTVDEVVALSILSDIAAKEPDVGQGGGGRRT